MTPFELLEEEFKNVESALKETLRHEYGPERSREYYEECATRLRVIRNSIASVARSDQRAIADHVDQLGVLATFISLFERSHLGEFSWPFSEVIRRITETLLSATNLKGEHVGPIIQVVSEGRGYRIVNETLASQSSKRRFAVVVFPRPLKHHVLLHTLFGHELGHTALYTEEQGDILGDTTLAALVSSGPMRQPSTVTSWLNDSGAPPEITAQLTRYQAVTGTPYEFTRKSWESWLQEFTCDLFGLLLFGPAFVAAHRALLQVRGPFAVQLVNTTHPPYALRQRLLVRALRLLGWDRPATLHSDGEVYSAEVELLSYVCHDPFSPWSNIFDDAQVAAAISGIRQVLAAHSHVKPERESLVHLVGRLANAIPPIREDFGDDDEPQHHSTPMSEVLYAGWAYWLGRKHLKLCNTLTFLQTNRLCDQALLQQLAIDQTLKSKPTK